MDVLPLADTIGTQLPVPDDYRAGEVTGWFFTIWAGGLAVLVFPWCVYMLVKRGNALPLLMWFGGLIVSLGEPMLDHLGHLWWPTDLPGPAFKGFDLDIPILIPLCYVFFVAIQGYWIYTFFDRGVTVKGVFAVWAAFAATDLLLEYPGVLTEAYTYYGDQPFELFKFPLWFAWINGTGFVMVAFAVWLLAPRLRGWRQLLLVFAPVVGFLGSYGMTAWPNFMALNWTMPDVFAWLLSAFSFLLCLAVLRGIAEAVATDRPLRDKLIAAAEESGAAEAGATNGRPKPGAVEEPVGA